MYIYAGIDGTGPGDRSRYAIEFETSFVRRLFRDARFQKRFYLQGPVWHGDNSYAKVVAMGKRLEKELHSQGKAKPRLILAGYSRGAAGAIKLASELAAHKHEVHCLLLFDAVDMTYTLEAETVPANVRHCFHAIRDVRSRSRTSWGNCGMKAENPKLTNYPPPKSFMCTHGGMGGVPWPVKRGEKETDFINEATTGKTPGWLPVVSPIGAGANEIHRRASRTAITYKQDKVVSAAVGSWMFNNLASVLKEAVPVG